MPSEWGAGAAGPLTITADALNVSFARFGETQKPLEHPARRWGKYLVT